MTVPATKDRLDESTASGATAEELATYHVDDLMLTPRADLVKLWGTLSAPKVPEEMAGEYLGYVHYGGDLALRAEQLAASFNLAAGKDFWLGKAFQTTGPNHGEGYNRFLTPAGEYKRGMRYRWEIGPSAVDGRPALVMRYDYYDNSNGHINLRDEARVLNKTNFLCTVYADKPVPGVCHRTQPDGKSDFEFFLLGGPIAPWHGLEEDLEVYPSSN